LPLNPAIDVLASRALSSPAKPLKEFELIARLTAGLPRSRRTILGPGDDCAILAPSAYPQLVTIDSMVEGVHFKLEWTTPEALGARALTVNLSDIAAMGGRPTAGVINLAIRAGLDQGFFERLYAGLRKAASAVRVDVIGGNITRATQLAITIALLGEARDGAMRRDQARVGDGIYVTGTVGDAALGLRLLQGSLKAAVAARRFLVGRYLNPTARLAAGQKLVRMTPRPAAIDLSDGLWQDLGHLLAASRAGAEIIAEALPLSDAYRQVMGDDVELACTGGDDYELLFCMAPRLDEAGLSRKLAVPVRRIGTIVKGRRAILLRHGRPAGDSAGRLAGWDQLRDAPP
jgi:thiamine-monophosphate kinase